MRWQSRHDTSTNSAASLMESVSLRIEMLILHGLQIISPDSARSLFLVLAIVTMTSINHLKPSGISIRSLLRLDLAVQYTGQSDSQWKCTYDSHNHILCDEHTNC